MTVLFYTLVVAFGLAAALTPLAGRLAVRYGLIDRPGGWRKIHPRPVPVAGGLAVLLASAGAVAVTLMVPSGLSDRLPTGGWLAGLGLAAIVICAVGVADDYARLRGRHKLL